MTLNANDVRNEYTASPGQTVFNYTFKIYESSDLNVYITPSGQECSESDLTTAYSVSGVGDENGGTITLTTPSSSGDLVTIVSSIPTSRTTDYQNNGDFRPDTVNNDFDRAYSLVKQIEDRANRSLQFGECLQGASSLSLPQPVANSFMRWKSDLSGLENQTIGNTGLQLGNTYPNYAAVRALDSSELNDNDYLWIQGFPDPWQVKTGAQTDNGWYIVFNDNPNRYAESTSSVCDVRIFGATGGGVADDSANIVNANSYATSSNKSLVFRPGSYACNSINITAPMNMEKGATLVYNGAQNGYLVDVTGANVKIGRFDADGNAEDCSLILFTGGSAKLEKAFLKNVTASATSTTSIYGMGFNSDNNNVGSVEVTGFENTGQSNASFPRGMAFVGTSDNNHVGSLLVDGCAAGLSFGTSTGLNTVDNYHAIELDDNGVYHLGGEAVIGEMHYFGNEEALVTRGNLTCTTLVTYGDCIGALELDDSGRVSVDNIVIMPDEATGDTASAAVITRAGSVSCGECYIGRISGQIKGYKILGIDDGTLEYLTIDSIDIKQEVFDDGNTPSTWMDMQAVEGFNIKSINVRMYDPTDADTSTFVMDCGEPSKESFLGSFVVSCKGSDEISTGGYMVRGASLSSGLITINYDKVVMQTNIGPYMRNVEYGLLGTANGTTPSIGTWRIGQRLYDSAPAASGKIGGVCINSGTNSSATDSTGDTDGSTATIAGMTDTSDFNVGHFVTVSAGFPSASDRYMIKSKTSSSITLDTDSTSVQSNVTVSTASAEWKEWGAIDA